MRVEEDFKVIEHHLCIKMPREVDHHNAGYITEQADEMIYRSEVKNLIFDFSDTEFMDSSGVGIILGRYKKITCFHGKVYAIHANMQIRKILHMSGLHKIIDILEER
ncbi:MAG: anti-sigma factor antagonist [Eubacterium sp.]|nr:anti-sigma factor antagonist [Eubacterium sp.]